jgi:hypothetical protein
MGMVSLSGLSPIGPFGKRSLLRVDIDRNLNEEYLLVEERWKSQRL